MLEDFNFYVFRGLRKNLKTWSQASQPRLNHYVTLTCIVIFSLMNTFTRVLFSPLLVPTQQHHNYLQHLFGCFCSTSLSGFYSSRSHRSSRGRFHGGWRNNTHISYNIHFHRNGLDITLVWLKIVFLQKDLKGGVYMKIHYRLTNWSRMQVELEWSI